MLSPVKILVIIALLIVGGYIYHQSQTRVLPIGCKTASDCPIGNSCQNGYCVPLTPIPQKATP